MKALLPHSGNRPFYTTDAFCRIRFPVLFMLLILMFSMMKSTQVMAQTLPVPPSAGNVASTESVDSLIYEASRRFTLPVLWIRSVMQVESGANARALSSKGAIGLMQIMPETYTTLRQAYDLGADPYEPRDNIMAGAAYMREMLNLYGTSGFLAAYNAGPARYDEHLATGEPLPEETQIYLSRLAPLLSGARDHDTFETANYSDWMTASLFIGDRTMSHSATISQNMGGFSNAHTHASQRLLAPNEHATIAALAPQSDGLFISTPSGPIDQRP
jgi:hypothetical protein